MSMRQRLGALIVAAFAIVFRRMPWMIRLLGPVMRWQLSSPQAAGPNALLSVRGRRSGRVRTVPVAFLDLGERVLLQAASARVGWVHDLRASSEAVITQGRRTERFEAAELSPEDAGRLIHDLL